MHWKGFLVYYYFCYRLSVTNFSHEFSTCSNGLRNFGTINFSHTIAVLSLIKCNDKLAFVRRYYIVRAKCIFQLILRTHALARMLKPRNTWTWHRTEKTWWIVIDRVSKKLCIVNFWSFLFDRWVNQLDVAIYSRLFIKSRCQSPFCAQFSRLCIRCHFKIDTSFQIKITGQVLVSDFAELPEIIIKFAK